MTGSRNFLATLGSIRTEVKLDGTGLWHASSPDLEGFLVTQPTLPELRRRIPDALYSKRVATQVELATSKANESMSEHYADKAIETLIRLLKITPHTHDCPDDEFCPVVDAERTVEAYPK